MILITDTQYHDPQARTSGIIINDWKDTLPLNELVHNTSKVAPYEPGKFYRRELPCILGLIHQHKLAPTHIVIDGHVYLDGNKQRGLGAYLYDALKEQVPVIGVAKNKFKNMPEIHAVIRGQSQTPLWITSIGIDFREAQNYVRAMAGNYRLPDMIKRADQLARLIP